MPNKILCYHCSSWVDCSNDAEKKGFCITENLYTYTEREECKDFEEGDPMTEQEYENCLF